MLSHYASSYFHNTTGVYLRHLNCKKEVWVTVFRDVKTSKWLGWFMHIEAPNSDHIFQSFYYAVQKFGIPDDVYLDNGKDYRCKDFAGGRRKPCVKGKGESDELSTCLKPLDGDVGTQAKPSTTGARKQKAGKIKVQHFRDKENSLIRNLGIDVHFALPYNAQTKPIERDFLKIKTFILVKQICFMKYYIWQKQI